MKPRVIRCLLAALGLAWVGGAFAADPGDPRDWLERMSTALSQMSYQGTFVYVQGEDVVTMRITHVSDDQGIRERLVSVSGTHREIIRDSDGVRWVMGDEHSVMQDQGFKRSIFPRLPLDNQGLAGRSYDLELGDRGRVAGRGVRVIEVLPRDEYRYGYSLWLEEDSAMLLKWVLVDSDRQPLAKLMFTDIKMGAQVDSSELDNSRPPVDYRTVESRLPTGLDAGEGAGTPRWEPSRLPPGFELTAHRLARSAEGSLFEHLVYSDGLAAVSVYVETDGVGAGQAAGLSRVGTTHAFSRSGDGVLITVVGDVPGVTVRMIADAVAPAAP